MSKWTQFDFDCEMQARFEEELKLKEESDDATLRSKQETQLPQIQPRAAQEPRQ